MKERKHKRKLNHVLILTSDAADANVKQFRIRAWLAEVIVIMLCILIGGVIGYFIYEGQLWENAGRRSHEQVVALEEENKTLAEQNSKLEAQVTEQAEEIQILSDTVSQKVQSENELSATLEKQSLPTEFPLPGSASMEEVTEGEPMCIFHASVKAQWKAVGKDGKILDNCCDFCYNKEHRNSQQHRTAVWCCSSI